MACPSHLVPKGFIKGNGLALINPLEQFLGIQLPWRAHTDPGLWGNYVRIDDTDEPCSQGEFIKTDPFDDETLPDLFFFFDILYREKPVHL